MTHSDRIVKMTLADGCGTKSPFELERHIVPKSSSLNQIRVALL
jgi:hypothetical protein